MKTFITLLFSLVSLSVCGQVFEWAKSFGLGDINHRCYDVAVDDLGSIYTIGLFLDSADFDPGPDSALLTSVGNKDIFIQKLDSDGSYEWARSFGGDLNDIPVAVCVGPDNSVYTVGQFSDTVDFNPNGNQMLLTSYGSIDIFIHKMDSDGNSIWAKSLGGSGNEMASSVRTDPNGNVYVLAKVYNDLYIDPNASSTSLNIAVSPGLVVLKLDSDGNLLWYRNFVGTGNLEGYSICSDQDGNVLLTGSFSDTLDITIGSNSNTFVTSDLYNIDVYICKLDTDGNFLWTRTFGGTFSDGGYDITTDDLGNVYTVGTFNGSMPLDFDPGLDSTFITGSGSLQTFIQKLNSDGYFVWAKAFIGGGNSSRSISVDVDKNVYTTGTSGNGVDFDPGVGYHTVYGNMKFEHKMDSAGNFQWVRTFTTGTTGNNDWGYSALDDDQNLIAVGTFNTIWDFNPNAGIFTLSAYGGRAFYVQKLSPCTPNSGTDTQTACDSYTWIDGITYTESNDSATYTVVDVLGCDSVVTLNLTILGTSSTSSINVTACSSYTSPSGNHTWTHDGTYTDVLTNQLGCDSIITIHLDILSNDTTVNWTVCDSTSSPSGLYTWTQSGTYNDTLTNSFNCDSVIVVHLTVNENNNASISSWGNNLLVANGADSYQWFNCDQNTPINGSTDLIYSPTANGSVAVITSVDGCADTSDCIYVAPYSCDVEFVLIPDASVDHNWFIVCSTLGFGNFTYLWSWGDGATSSGFYSSHTYAQPGYYDICLTVSDSLLGCTETYCDSSAYIYKTMEMITVNVVDELPNGIAEGQEASPVTFYPNPTTGSLMIDLGSTSDRVTINVYNLLGELVKSEIRTPKGLIDFELPETVGLYIVQLLSDNGSSHNFKVIKK